MAAVLTNCSLSIYWGTSWRDLQHARHASIFSLCPHILPAALNVFLLCLLILFEGSFVVLMCFLIIYVSIFIEFTWGHILSSRLFWWIHVFSLLVLVYIHSIVGLRLHIHFEKYQVLMHFLILVFLTHFFRIYLKASDKAFSLKNTLHYCWTLLLVDSFPLRYPWCHDFVVNC